MRSRMIRPEFWSDEKLARVSRDSRLLFAGLWSTSDDYGVTKGHPMWLRSQIFPYDDIQQGMIEKWLHELEEIGVIIKFIHNGETFYYIKNFKKHQTVDKPSKARNPEPPENILEEHSRDTRETLATESRDAIDETETETETETEEIVSNGQKEKTPFDAVASLYNEICQSLPKLQKLTAKRKREIRTRWRSYPDLETFKRLFQKAEESDFLTGRNGRWTGCNFDWLIKESNMVKVLEGCYDNKGVEIKKNVRGMAPPASEEKFTEEKRVINEMFGGDVREYGFWVSEGKPPIDEWRKQRCRADNHLSRVSV
jgi:hypothetical protein